MNQMYRLLWDDEVITQEKLQEAVTAAKTEAESQFKAQLKEYQELAETLRSKASLSAKEKETYETQLKTLKSQLMTSEELKREEIQRKETELTEKLGQLESDRDGWRTRFQTTLVERQLADAAVKNEAFNPSQIVSLLRPLTAVVEATDEKGRPTGSFTAQVDWSVKNDDGKVVSLKLTPEQVVQKMAANADYFNLFKSALKKGPSASQHAGDKRDLKEIARDPVAWREERKSWKK